MIVAYGLEDIPFEKNSVVTVGSFDGVHKAHQTVIQEVVERARHRGGRSVVVTFDPHPKEVLRKGTENITLLSTLEERQELCAELGVGWFVVIHFTYEFSRQGFRDFFLRYLVKGIGVSEMVEGYDHHFGRDREGSIEELLKLGKEFQFSVVAMKPVYIGDEIVSSSRVRQLLVEGNVEKTCELLGRPYTLKGTVVRGDGRGRSLGFPTANIQLETPRKIVPKNGIYFVEARIGNDSHFGLSNVGVRPTFVDDGERLVEVYVLDLDQDLYGAKMEVSFLQRLRDELKFDSAEELITQMEKDKEVGERLRSEFTKIYKISTNRRSVQKNI